MKILVLLDSLNNVGTWKLKKSNDDGESITEEYINGDSWVEIYFLRLNSKNKIPGESIVEISFNVNGEYKISGKSGTKESLEIFTVVVDSIRKMIDEINPKGIKFSANIDDGASELKKGSRVRLYDRMIGRINGYKLKSTNIHDDVKDYILTRIED